jgi:ABC-2 type transport system ATP-binding protein
MLLGLVAADAGHMRIFDHEVPLAINQVIDRVGAIVEQPKFFPAFSGQKNLQLLARAIGAPRRRVAAVLEEVGLARRGRDKFGNYSLGMKQRLAISSLRADSYLQESAFPIICERPKCSPPRASRLRPSPEGFSTFR